jgi:hypothetical protein
LGIHDCLIYAVKVYQHKALANPLKAWQVKKPVNGGKKTVKLLELITVGVIRNWELGIRTHKAAVVIRNWELGIRTHKAAGLFFGSSIPNP